MNVIKFLADRIAFLNSRIKTFSEKTTLEKLAAYLLYRYAESGEEIEISKTALASEIGVGRASLYRDLDTLANDGIIALKNKTVIIICPKGLERIKQ
jgi:CRP-like cAMP-binding protein